MDVELAGVEDVMAFEEQMLAHAIAKVAEVHGEAVRERFGRTDPSSCQLDREPSGLPRRLLADAADQFLNNLPAGRKRGSALPTARAAQLSPETTEDLPGLAALILLVTEAGMAAPELGAEVCDPITGQALTAAAAFWLEGLQRELDNPVVLIPTPAPAGQAALDAQGFQGLPHTDSLARHIERLRAEYARD